MKLDDRKIAVIGLGYVGLPLAMEFAKTRPVVGFDIRRQRIDELLAGRDSTLEVDPVDLRQAERIELPTIPKRCAGAASSSSPCRRRSTGRNGRT